MPSDVPRPTTAPEKADSPYIGPGMVQAATATIKALEAERDRYRGTLQGLLVYVRAYPSIPDLAVQMDKRIVRALNGSSQDAT